LERHVVDSFLGDFGRRLDHLVLERFKLLLEWANGLRQRQAQFPPKRRAQRIEKASDLDTPFVVVELERFDLEAMPVLASALLVPGVSELLNVSVPADEFTDWLDDLGYRPGNEWPHERRSDQLKVEGASDR
jgi:hypothetical protein